MVAVTSTRWWQSSLRRASPSLSPPRPALTTGRSLRAGKLNVPDGLAGSPLHRRGAPMRPCCDAAVAAQVSRPAFHDEGQVPDSKVGAIHCAPLIVAPDVGRGPAL